MIHYIFALVGTYMTVWLASFITSIVPPRMHYEQSMKSVCEHERVIHSFEPRHTLYLMQRHNYVDNDSPDYLACARSSACSKPWEFVTQYTGTNIARLQRPVVDMSGPCHRCKDLHTSTKIVHSRECVMLTSPPY